jgi:hypothetical protein
MHAHVAASIPIDQTLHAAAAVDACVYVVMHSAAMLPHHSCDSATLATASLIVVHTADATRATTAYRSVDHTPSCTMRSCTA